MIKMKFSEKILSKNQLIKDLIKINKWIKFNLNYQVVNVNIIIHLVNQNRNLLKEMKLYHRIEDRYNDYFIKKVCIIVF